MTRRKRLLFGCLMVAGTLAFLEASAALVYHVVWSEPDRQTAELAMGLGDARFNQVPRYVAHPYFLYRPNPSYRSPKGRLLHNAQGFRGSRAVPEKGAGMVRVVAVGGSTTYGAYFGNEENVWPARLERKLRERFGPRVEVINAGVSNYTTFELIGLLAMRIPELSPDIVLIHTGLNDAFAVGFPDEGGPDNTAFRHTWSYREPAGWLRAGMRASRLVRVAGLKWLSSRGGIPGDLSAAIQYPPPPDREFVANAATATGRYFRRNLRSLLALCTAMSATPVLINEPINPAEEQPQRAYLREVIRAIRRNNRIMEETARESRTAFVDAFSRMRDPALFVDAAHETAPGMEIKAAAVADQLAPLVEALLQPSP